MESKVEKSLEKTSRNTMKKCTNAERKSIKMANYLVLQRNTIPTHKHATEKRCNKRLAGRKCAANNLSDAGRRLGNEKGLR